MSRSTPVCHLYCSKCKAKYPPTWQELRKLPRMHLNVEVIEVRGNGVLCRCRKCGHEYISTSAAGRYACRILQRKQEREGTGVKQ